MAEFTIESKGSKVWKTEAEGYVLTEGFFHFHDAAGSQVFAVIADHVSSITVER